MKQRFEKVGHQWEPLKGDQERLEAALAITFEEEFPDECECGSTDGLSQHITTLDGTISLSEKMCVNCRAEIRKGLHGMLAGCEFWKSNDESREYFKKIAGGG